MSCPHPLVDKKKRNLKNRLLKNDRDGGSQKLGDAVSQRLARLMHLLESMGKDCLVTSKYFAVSSLLNPCCWMWLLLKQRGANAFLSMSQLFCPAHIDKLETLRTFTSVLYKQFKIDFSFAQHCVQLLFLNAFQLIWYIHSFFVFALHSCFWVSYVFKSLPYHENLYSCTFLINSEYQDFPPAHQYT